tara:strand:+ start:471 stop:827 length:357 start_codon:yes stop_codon:yes gene_type:complete
MALANKKQERIVEKTDTNSKFYISNAKQTEMSASFTNAEHLNDSAIYGINKSILYQLDLMQDEIDELRRYVTNEATGSAVKSISAVSVSNLPTSATGLSSGQLYVLAEKNGTKTIKSA